MDFYACESFIEFCDDMMIGAANEGKIKNFFNKLQTFSASKAKTANSMADIKKHTLNNAPLIKLGDSIVIEKLKTMISEAKKSADEINKNDKAMLNAAAASVVTNSEKTAAPFLAAGELGNGIKGTIHKNKYYGLAKYHIKQFNGDNYLALHNVKIKE